ncbi:LuxR C-terminal-related transcriptional regulator [Kineobactrum salinum]|uniref:HTH luxR-type domain-containing protein n=1 Tax=Kineobactrum salinum TaxID=2708301 RepID=A0A6C0U1U0_9GAMM|nr:LuxR C-terminal-related transcriptional regulator [Kineobactrum salinum]QIB64957.1 hypothetical protein G3T16_05660 [Kineobactrum salinum]
MAQIVRLPATADTRRTPAKQSGSRDFLARPRLIAALEEHQPALMLLLHAPAGYGKTVLLRQYQAYLTAAGADVCWLTLSEADRDDNHLGERLCASVPCISGDTLSGRARAGLENDCFVVLDNVERIVGSAGEKLLLGLLEQKWPGLHLLLASRTQPHFGVVRWQLTGDLVIVNAGSLCFDPEELAACLADKRLALPKAAIGALYRVSGGWPAAIRVAVMGLQQDGADIDRLLEADPYSWRQLHRYIGDEILAAITDDLRTFALDIAPLGRVTAEFAGELTARQNAGALLGVLEELGLLVQEDCALLHLWYRFHPLLSKFLEGLLKKENPARLVEVHRAAVAWNRQSGRLSDAVRHAFAAGDTSTAAELLEQASWERRRHGRATPVAEWSDQLPDEAYDKHPLLRTEAACSFATSFALEAARMHANSIRKQFSDLDPIIREDLFAVDTLIKIYADQPEDLVEVAERGLRDCVVRDPYTTGTLHLASAIGLIARSKLDKARRAVLEARIDNERAENAFGVAVSHMLLGLVHAVEGNLSGAVQAWQLADEVIQPATELGLVDKIAIGYLPEALYEWNRPEEAREYLGRCLDSPAEIMLPDMLASTYLAAARIAALEGVDQAFATLDAAEALAAARNWPRFLHIINWERVRLALQTKRFDDARRFRAKVVGKPDFVEQPGIMSHAMELDADLIGELRYASLVSPNPAIISRLRSAVTQAVGQGRKWRATRLLIIEAVCRKALGDQNAALRAMRSALKYGSEGNMIRSFVDEGPLAMGLVRQIHDMKDSGTDDIRRDYLNQLLQAGGSQLPAMEEEPVVCEQLSERELEILKLIYDGGSNADIARRLFISENTVKWHLQHVYSKLGVKNRTAAVAAARVFNLIG